MDPGPCEATASPAAAGAPGVDDLTWLAYRAADALGDALNKVSRDAGLADLRDWLVLALISGDQAQRTQLEIATQLGIDKSTLVPLLDRLEQDGLIVRTTSERDRRVRIPQATPPASRSSGRSPSPGTQPSTIASPPSPHPSGPASTPRSGESWQARHRRNEPDRARRPVPGPVRVRCGCGLRLSAGHVPWALPSATTSCSP